MSQKPRTGAQAKAASSTMAAAKEVAARTGPVDLEPLVKAEPAVTAAPIVKMEPVAKVDSVVTPPVEIPVSPSVAVPTSIEITTELAPGPAPALTETITAEAVKPAAATMPTKPTPTQGMKTMMKSTEDFVAFGQANLEAFVKSGQIWSAGVQELTKQFATTAKASFDESVSTFKAISTAKSVKEAMELQSTFAKAALEKAMAESNKLTDASIKLTEQALAPITARVADAVETFGKAA